MTIEFTFSPIMLRMRDSSGSLLLVNKLLWQLSNGPDRRDTTCSDRHVTSRKEMDEKTVVHTTPLPCSVQEILRYCLLDHRVHS